MSATETKLEGVVTLNEIVHSYKLWTEKYGDEDYDRLLDIVIRATADINIHHLRQVEVSHLTPNDNNIVALPADFVSEVKVGLNVNGRIYILTENPNITIPVEEDCGDIDRDTAASNGNIIEYFVPHYCGGEYMSTMYGITGGYEKIYYKMDKPRNRIILEGAIPYNLTAIILEYVSSGIKIGTQTVIPLYAKEPILARLRWMTAEPDPTVPVSEKMRLMNLYGIEERKMKRMRQRLNLAQFKATVRRSYSRGLKR